MNTEETGRETIKERERLTSKANCKSKRKIHTDIMDREREIIQSNHLNEKRKKKMKETDRQNEKQKDRKKER